MNLSTIKTIAKKEFFGFINSPLAYTVIVPFLLLSVFMYLRVALVGGEANLRPYFELLPWFLVLVAPAISMRLLADEYRNQTLELLFAHPVSELEIIIGKFLGAAAFYAVMLATTLGLPLTLFIYSRPDAGQIAGQYIGAFLIGLTFISLSTAAAAYVKNAISSFLLGAAVSFALILAGLDFVTQLLPYPFNLVVTQLSVLPHGDAIARGLLDIRDVFYFVSITAFFLAVTVLKLSERKTVEQPAEKRKLTLALFLISGIGVAANILLSYYPIRVDLTQARLFTLSRGTRQTMQKLPDIVTVTLYRSRSLPAQMQLVAREVSDVLKDYSKLGRNFRFKEVYPEDNAEALSDAASAGIREVQFNSIAAGKFEVQSGVLGLAIRYGEKTESIPFISDTGDLEYQLTRRIRKLTTDTPQTLGLLETGYAQHEMLDEFLKTQYDTKVLATGETISSKDFAAVIFIDDGMSESTASATLKTYLANGGRALVLASGVSIDLQSLSAQKSNSPTLTALSDYGVTIKTDLVYDVQLAETLTFGGQSGQRYLASYPYWFKALPATDSFSPLATVKSISIGWPSSIALESKEGVVQKVLLTTGPNAGKTENTFSIAPQNTVSLKPNDKNIPIAAYIEKGETRLVVVSASQFIQDQFLQNNRDNVAFLSNTIDFLAADKDLAAIPSKSAGRSVFEFRSPTDLYIAQYGNLFIPPVAVTAFALWYLRRRKQLTKRTYVK